jgi:beta-hexosaminidase Fdl
MLCGSQTLWPEPTVKSLIGTNANSFRLTDVQYKVQTPFKNVESLMESAFSIFLEEIKQIRSLRTSTRSYRDATYSGSRVEQTHHRRNLTTVNIYVNVIKTADVHLTLNMDECYNITMSSKCSSNFPSPMTLNPETFSDEHQKIDVKITANTFFGARNGLSTLQQLVWYDDEDDVLKIISAANIVDCPKFP